MSKNYIEKVIEEKVSFEPDYSKIKEQVNIKPKKANKKRWVWPSLSIGFVFIAVIIAIIVSLSLRSNPYPTPTPTYDGVHFNNYSNNGSGGGDGEPLPPPPMVSYSIDVEKDNYDYNEEFIIKYTIAGLRNLGGYDDYIEPCNNLNVKIVSDKFEFLSPTEYHFDLETDTSTYGNILSFGNEEKTKIFPIEMELKVKAKKQSDGIENISFLLEFPLKNEFKEMLNDYYDKYDKGETYQYMLDEFTKDFEWVHRLYYINDELGTLLVDNGKKFEYPNTNPKWSKTITVPAKTEIMYRSLNRLYSNNLISEKNYIKKLISYFTDNMTYLGWEGTYVQDKHIVSYQYYSRNFRVDFNLNDEYDYLFELYQKDQESRIQATKDLVRILYEEGKITLEEYNNEISLIDKEGVLRDGSWQGFFCEYNEVLVPFKNRTEYYFDLYIEI